MLTEKWLLFTIDRKSYQRFWVHCCAKARQPPVLALGQVLWYSIFRMKALKDLQTAFPVYLAALGVLLTLTMFVVLVNNTDWHPLWHPLMLAFVLLSGASTYLLLKIRQWAALLLIVSGIGAFFSFMLAYAQAPLTLGSNYPLVLFAIAPLCVSGVWVAAEGVDDEDFLEEQSAPPVDKG